MAHPAGSVAARSAAAIRAVRLAGSVAWKHLADDPVRAAVLAHRIAPRWVRGRADPVLARAGPLGRALVGWHRARKVPLAEIATATSPRTLRQLAAFALAVDRPDAARQALARLPADDPARWPLRARLAWREGRLREAAELLRAAQAGAGEVAAVGRVGGTRLRRRWSARLLRRIEGELTVLSGRVAVPRPSYRPARLPPGRYRGRGAVPGRVLHLVTNAQPYANAGYTVRTQRVVSAQRAAGLDAHVATRVGFPVTRGVLDGRRFVVVDGVPYHRLLPGALPATADDELARGIELASDLVHRLRPAVVHAASDHVNGQLALALRERFGIPVVYEVRGFPEESWLSRIEGRIEGRTGGRDSDCDHYRLSRERETWCMRQADAVVTLGAAMAEEIVGRGIPADKISVVPNAVDDVFFQPLPDAAGVRARLGMPRDAVIVGTVSTFYGYEGLDTLLRAGAELRRRAVPVRLLLVGDGPELPALRRLAGDLGLGDAAVFPGRVPHAAVRSYYAALDIFVLPRTNHRVCHLVTPLKPVEAMASGLAVVASDVTALRELVEPGLTGALIPPEHPRALADCLQRLLYSPIERADLGRAARAAAARDRTWRAAAARYRQTYQAVGALP